ncbi:hypothetical protein [Haloferax sp. DFSO60]|uniref:hypothetical protein n=1 Tax=Haloferax sp. DFSO60 TaxID=3388652 RepID=UPI00397B8F64
MLGRDGTSDRVRRRTYLGLAASAGLAGLAGCSSGGTASAARGPPTVPEGQLADGGWEKIDEQTVDPLFERSFGPVEVTAAMRTFVYEDIALKEELREKTLGQAEGQFAMFFASRVSLDPSMANIPDAVSGPVIDQTEGQAREQFEAQLEDAGLVEIQQSSTGTIEIDTGETARLTEYTAGFPFPGIEFPVNDERTLTFEGETIGVTGLLAVWEHRGSILIAGGAHPGENLDMELSKAPTDAIEVTVDIDLGLTPEAYLEELRSLITAVE